MTYEKDEDGGVLMGEDGFIVYKYEDPNNNRRNYRQSNNVNYLDGDRASQLEKWQDDNEGVAEAGEEEEAEEEEGEEVVEESSMNDDDKWTENMYRRETNTKDNPSSTLVNNHVRVVKGGSWKDRAYYLQASTRRYYDQNKSTSWIGFRCAMDRLGSRAR